MRYRSVVPPGKRAVAITGSDVVKRRPHVRPAILSTSC
jgi:hypothetical protein